LSYPGRSDDQVHCVNWLLTDGSTIDDCQYTSQSQWRAIIASERSHKTTTSLPSPDVTTISCSIILETHALATVFPKDGFVL